MYLICTELQFNIIIYLNESKNIIRKNNINDKSILKIGVIFKIKDYDTD